MRPGRVVLVGPPGDAQVRAVTRALGGRAELLDVSALAHGEPFTLDPARPPLPAAVYVRALPSTFPPLRPGADGRALVAERWLTPFMLARERADVVTGLLLEWHARGVRLLNPPGPGGFAQNKLQQLLCGQRLGVPLPRTRVTNDPAAARAFIRRHRQVIAKPASGGALARVVGPREPLHALRASPVILQERIPGDDVRLFLLGGRVLSCRALRLPGAPVVDFRGSAAYQAGRATYEPVRLPADIRRAAVAWARANGLVLAGVDLRRTPRGRLVFLECNSSPIWLDQEEKTGDSVTAAVAAWLAPAPTGRSS
ncbi:MAG: hypothetical protein HY904_24255 [Deltaproteobacteria bacterium]|nr:hypothetical protein [Deltaproteobacteria bacterium]